MQFMYATKKLSEPEVCYVDYYVTGDYNKGYGIKLVQKDLSGNIIDEEIGDCGLCFRSAVKIIEEMASGDVLPSIAKDVMRDYLYFRFFLQSTK